MATATLQSVGRFDSDTEFRQWVQAWITALTTGGGLMQTADTGQIDPTTAVRPATNTVAGYAIFRFNDALQATSPVFVKVEFGAGNTVSRASLWVTVGSGSNGAGVITNAGPRMSAAGTSDPASGQQFPIFASGGPGRIAVSHAVGAAQSGVFIIERPREADGTISGDGTLVIFGQGASAYAGWLPNGAAFQGWLNVAQQIGLPVHSLWPAVQAWNSEVAVIPLILLIGRPRFFLTSIAASQIAYGTQVTLASFLGAAHTLVSLGTHTSHPQLFGNVTANNDAHALLIPWE